MDLVSAEIQIIRRLVILMHGRAGGIRTRDLLDPNEALYQAEPRPEMQNVRQRGFMTRFTHLTPLSGGKVPCAASEPTG